ncbi:NAD-dependent epimerase/dehydratase family protein [Halomonas heilongjiangensis]|uniref:Nucleoside-diphosphate sugar epimerase n=2 Tax=Halomonas heilongjiangensis TaxID=1387883 RepID=A0A2N7TH85_9GAMM|nr:NAD(P)-dependent oxidoreductase [Halomonas heilongjiangensis]PMR67555.1 nucleoside-diphosphate sugar epimerase [Halomonas heilongjiangensis]PXX87127.1 nucleoside-diphosphate sugar epimerase [Halomonas heilongjiangensis]
MRVLISGGSGFLGAWIIRRLLKGGHEVRVLDRRGDSRLVESIAGSLDGVEWRLGDVSVSEDVMAAVAGCDAVIHLAALLTPACRDDPLLGARVNLVGTLNLFEAARRHGLSRLVYASSAGVFGPDDGGTPNPMTHYGAFKLACEGCARAYFLDAGIDSVGFRPLVIYGPGRERGLSAGPTLACRAAVARQPYTIPFTGMADFIFVGDVAAAFEAAVTRDYSGAHVFNLRGETASVAALIAEIRRQAPEAALEAAGEALPIHAELEASELSPVLGDLPRTTLRDGLSRTLDFYRQ